MAVAPWALFLGLVAVVGGIPLYLANLRPTLRTNLLYGHLGLLQLLRGFVAATYVMPLAEGLAVTPGNVMYTGIMMTAILLLLVERRTAVLRSVILLLLGTEAIKLAVFASTRWALRSPDFINLAGVGPDFLAGFLRISFTGALLIILELVVVVAVLEQVRRRVSGARALSLSAIGVFAGAIVLDGVLFPLVTEPLDPGLGTVIESGVAAKAVLAAVFCLPVVVFVFVRREPQPGYLTAPLRLRDVLLAPRHRLVARLEETERERIALLERAMDVAEEERRRLAEDLHDDAIQLLTAADLRLQRLAAASPDVDVDRIQELLRSGVGSLRRLILELRGPDVTAANLQPLLRAYVDRLVTNGELRVSLDVDLPDEVPADVAAGAYRIVLEALSNAYRHADAGEVLVTLTTEAGLLRGEVADDGVGIPDDVETGPGHLGLRAMDDRVDMLGGCIEVRRGDRGTIVAFDLPIEPVSPTDDPV